MQSDYTQKGFIMKFTKYTMPLIVTAFVAVTATMLVWTLSPSQSESSSLPHIKIDLPHDAPALSRTEWTDECRVRIFDEEGKRLYATAHLSLRGRGNSTFDKPKRPYKLKFETARSLFGLPANTKFNLLSCFFDHALIRNELAFEVCRQTSLASTTPQGRFVKVTVNGEYQGIYYLCQGVRDRMDEETLLLEFDTYAVHEEKHTFYTDVQKLPVAVRQPEKLPAILFDEVRHIVNQAEQAPLEHIDLETFADYFLVHELCQNGEPNGPRSCFMHALPNGRLAAGPAWDFDLAFINVNVDEKHDLRPQRLSHLPGLRHLNGDSLYNAQALWYARLMKEEVFVDCVKTRWQLLKPRFEALTQHIDSLHSLLEEEAIIDQQKWNHLEPARFDSCTTYQSAIATLRNTYVQRIEKLDSLVFTL